MSFIERRVVSISCVTGKLLNAQFFFNYTGVVIFRYFLSAEHYENFVRLFCATSICSTLYFRRFLPVAKQLFKEFIKVYYDTFSSATSNIHNVILDEVVRFGPLPTLSSYPFENHLYKIKNMLRSLAVTSNNK